MGSRSAPRICCRGPMTQASGLMSRIPMTSQLPKESPSIAVALDPKAANAQTGRVLGSRALRLLEGRTLPFPKGRKERRLSSSRPRLMISLQIKQGAGECDCLGTRPVP